MLSTMKIRNNLKAKEYRRRDIEILPKYNRTTYLVEGNNIYNKRYDRNGVTTWECCSNSFCGGRLLSRHNEFFKESTDHATYCKGNAAKIEEKKFHGMAYQLCKDTVTPRTYNQIYGLISLAYPRVAMRFSKKEMTSTLVTWKYGMARLPNTIEELNCAMNDPELYEKYGKNTFGDFTIEEPGYRCYDDVYETQFVGDDNLLQTSKIVAFRCYTSVEHVRGTRVDLAGDGSAGPCPVNVAFKKLLFDDLQQLYVVHMIIHKKLHPVGLFLLQHLRKEVYVRLFQIVRKWFGDDETTIATIMLDFEKASRSAALLVWPNILVLPCAFHYQKRIGYFAITFGIFNDKSQSASRQLLDMALGLCFLPEAEIVEAIKVIRKSITPSSAKFGNALVEYLAKTWLPKQISVANLEVRVNNGSEIFFSATSRDNRSKQNNILEFCSFVQSVVRKVSIELTQWHILVQPRKQLDVERAIIRNLATFHAEKAHYNAELAIKNFLNNTKQLTKHVHKFHDKLAHNENTLENIDYTKLIITAKQASQSSSCTKEPFHTAILKLVPDENSNFSTKTIKLKTSSVLTIRNAKLSTAECPSNLNFNNSSIANFHAEFLLKGEEVFIRDLGSDTGTFINNQRTGRPGVPWTPRLITSGCHLRFGEVGMDVTIDFKQKKDIADDKTTASTAATPLATVKLFVRSEDEYPLRTVPLYLGKKESIGRATTATPPQPNNALFRTAGISKIQLQLWCTEHGIFLKPAISTFPAYINGKKIGSLLTPTSGNIIELGIEKHITFTLLYSMESVPVSVPTISLQHHRTGLKFPRKTISFDNALSITIGNATEYVSATASNGIFAATSLCENHAHFYILNEIINLLDCNTSSGTFITKSQHPTQRLKAHEPVIVTHGDIVQFGNSFDPSEFVMAKVSINKQTAPKPTNSDAHTTLSHHNAAQDECQTKVQSIADSPSTTPEHEPETSSDQYEADINLANYCQYCDQLFDSFKAFSLHVCQIYIDDAHSETDEQSESDGLSHPPEVHCDGDDGLTQYSAPRNRPFSSLKTMSKRSNGALSVETSSDQYEADINLANYCQYCDQLFDSFKAFSLHTCEIYYCTTTEHSYTKNENSESTTDNDSNMKPANEKSSRLLDSTTDTNGDEFLSDSSYTIPQLIMPENESIVLPPPKFDNKTVEDFINTWPRYEQKLRRLYSDNLYQYKKTYYTPELERQPWHILDYISEKQYAALLSFLSEKLRSDALHDGSDIVFECILPTWILSLASDADQSHSF